MVFIFPFLHDELPLWVGENIMSAFFYVVGAHEGLPSLEQRTKDLQGFLNRGNSVAFHTINHVCFLPEEDVVELCQNFWRQHLVFFRLVHLLMQTGDVPLIYNIVHITDFSCWRFISVIGGAF